MKEKQANTLAGSDAPTCSLLGDALPPWITKSMEDCTTCGSRPKNLLRVAHPRLVTVTAMSAPWKCNCVCMVCGYFVTGKTTDDAVNAWNEHRTPAGYYNLPDDCSDMNLDPENDTGHATSENQSNQKQ